MYDILVENRGILATICVGLIGAFTAIYVQRRNAFRSAALNFRTAFIEELDAIECATDNQVCARDVLLSSYEKHRNAVAEFRLHLGPIQRHRFDKAWKEHHLNSKYEDVRRLFEIHESEHPYLQYLWSNAGNEIAARKLAAEGLRGLLKHAKP